MILTNDGKLSLSVAVWLASDSYDYNNDPNHLSATEIMKPIRQLILAPRVPSQEVKFDIAERIPSAMGTALHDGIYNSWMDGGYLRALTRMGLSQNIIDRIVVNPESGTQIADNAIVVYQEQRLSRNLGKWVISGKPDFIGDGILEDFKSTGVYAYIKGRNEEKYCKQGSIYRWLAPDIIKSDYIIIQFIFTDWSKLRSMTEEKYPKSRILAHKVPLWSLEKTEAYIMGKLAQFEELYEAVQSDIPECTQEELWQDPSVFKYYKKPGAKRSTRNFDSYHEAHERQLKDGNVGMIKEVKGQVKACLYCAAFAICEQKDQLILAGLLDINE
jgi:hypothetical protein